MIDIIFSSVFTQKWGVFVLIRKQKARTFQNSPYFCLQASSSAIYGLLNEDHSFFWDTNLQIGIDPSSLEFRLGIDP